MPFNYKIAQQNIANPELVNSSEELEEIQQIPQEEIPQEIPQKNEVPQEQLEPAPEVDNFAGENIPNIAQAAQDIENTFVQLKNNTIMNDLSEDKQAQIVQGVLNNLGDFLNAI